MANIVRSRRSDLVWWLHRHYRNSWHNLAAAFSPAVINGDIHLAEWLLSAGASWYSSDRLPHQIAAQGNLPVLQWLEQQQQLEVVEGLVVKAAGKGHFHVVRWLVDEGESRFYRASGGNEARFAIHTAAIHCHLEIAKFLREAASGTRQGSSADQLRELTRQLDGSNEAAVVSRRTLIGAARNGHLDVVQWLISEYGDDSATDLFDSKNNRKNDRTTAMDAASCNGHLDVLQYLHDLVVSTSLNVNKRKRKQSGRKTGPTCTKNAMDDAAGSGFLNVVQWLHQHRQEGCSTRAMDAAATGGHLEVVKWLHRERSEGCTSAAMDGAATNGHIEAVQWLHDNINANCTTEAMDGAAANGHLEIVKWLHLNRSEGCTTKAMDGAAAGGLLAVVKWLHRNRTEGCTTEAMDKAIQDRYLGVAQWLHSHRQEDCSISALDAVADHAYFDGFLFLHSQCNVKCTVQTALLTRNHGTPEIHEWILEHYPEFRAEMDNEEASSEEDE